MQSLEKLLRLKKLYEERASGRLYIDPFAPLTPRHTPAMPSEGDSLREMVESCLLCELSKGEGKPIFGACTAHSRVVFISEVPLTDPKHPSIFVGRSGEMLRNIIKNVLALEENEVALLSLLKCQPPLSQRLESSFFSACKPYILKQIELLPPHAILVPLGEVAYRHLTEERGEFSAYRGHATRWAGHRMIPTFSLNHLLRNPKAKKEAWQDFLLIKSHL